MTTTRTKKWEAISKLDILVYDVTAEGKGYIVSKAMKCDYPSTNITKDVAVLVAEYLDLLEMNREPEYTKRKNDAAKLPLDTPKRNRWVGNTLCEVTAMEPRNQGRSSF